MTKYFYFNFLVFPSGSCNVFLTPWLIGQDLANPVQVVYSLLTVVRESIATKLGITVCDLVSKEHQIHSQLPSLLITSLPEKGRQDPKRRIV
jgi:hypothetical protein